MNKARARRRPSPNASASEAVECLLKQWRTTGSLELQKPSGAMPGHTPDHLPMIEQGLMQESDLRNHGR